MSVAWRTLGTLDVGRTLSKTKKKKKGKIEKPFPLFPIIISIDKLLDLNRDKKLKALSLRKVVSSSIYRLQCVNDDESTIQRDKKIIFVSIYLYEDKLKKKGEENWKKEIWLSAQDCVSLSLSLFHTSGWSNGDDRSHPREGASGLASAGA